MDANSHIVHEVHTQRPEKLNVWTGSSGNHLVGLFFLSLNLHGEVNSQLLETNVESIWTKTIANMLLYFNKTVLDPPYYGQPILQFWKLYLEVNG